MTWDCYEYKIAEHYVFPLVCGDYEGMTESEISQFQTWLEFEQDGIVGHWSIGEHDGDDFGRCAVSGLFANRATVRYNFKKGI